MEFYGATDKGIVRKENQDVFLCEDVRITGGILLAVCDGMGGAKAGHIASTMGLNVFRDSFFKDLDPFYDEKAIAQSLVNAIQQANTEMYRQKLHRPGVLRNGHNPCCGLCEPERRCCGEHW